MLVFSHGLGNSMMSVSSVFADSSVQSRPVITPVVCEVLMSLPIDCVNCFIARLVRNGQIRRESCLVIIVMFVSSGFNNVCHVVHNEFRTATLDILSKKLILTSDLALHLRVKKSGM